jgi:hypothetical protein
VGNVRLVNDSHPPMCPGRAAVVRVEFLRTCFIEATAVAHDVMAAVSPVRRSTACTT